MKRIILLFLTLILTGCSVEYTLDIDKKINLVETVSVDAKNESEIKSIQDYNGNLPIDIEIDDSYAFDEKVDGIEYYKIKKNKDNTNIKFNYKYNLDKYENNVFTNNCYEYVTSMKNDNQLILSTSNKFSCFEKYNQLSDVKITIKSKYKLIDTNADLKEKHQYTWYINKDNFNDKSLYLSLDTSIEDLTFFEKLLRGDYFNSFTVTLLIASIGFIIYIFLKKKSNNIDKI